MMRGAPARHAVAGILAGDAFEHAGYLASTADAGNTLRVVRNGKVIA
jgi:hypothetical protein